MVGVLIIIEINFTARFGTGIFIILKFILLEMGHNESDCFA
jgi:hypothetical protein